MCLTERFGIGLQNAKQKQFLPQKYIFPKQQKNWQKVSKVWLKGSACFMRKQ